MSRCIATDMVVELTWETLLGLDKEPREIRDLCRRRSAGHFVLLTDDFGLRNAGLATKDDTPADATRYALAAILASRVAGKPFVFLHSVPEADGLAIVICIKSGRPEIDRVLPREDAMREANLFLESLDDPPSVHGDIPLSGIASHAMALPDTRTLSDEERIACKIGALTGRRSFHIGRPAMLALALATALGIPVAVWAIWPAEPASRPPEAATIRMDPVKAYLARVEHTLKPILTAPSHEPARRIHALLSELPLSAGQWRVHSVACRHDHCNALWQREVGGTLDSLLDARPAAVLQEANLDEAIETIPLEISVPPRSPLRLMSRDQFYLRAGSRAQTLRDNKIEVVLEAPKPLLPVPEGISADDDRLATLPRHGDWLLAGHLAFLDSLTGLLERTGNMQLDVVNVDTDPAAPRFSAKGKFYVH